MTDRTKNATPTLVVVISMLITLAGCASYGWADSDRNGTGQAIRVLTPQLPAHHGFDASALRTVLIDELELLGANVVSAGDVPSLLCAVVDDGSSGFGDTLFAEFDVECHIPSTGFSDGTVRFRATGQATGGAAGDQMTLHDTSDAGHRAVADALTRIAPRVVRYLDESSNSRRDVQ